MFHLCPFRFLLVFCFCFMAALVIIIQSFYFILNTMENPLGVLRQDKTWSYLYFYKGNPDIMKHGLCRQIRNLGACRRLF